jgi:hypothetical protein
MTRTRLKQSLDGLRDFGPYVLVELLLPGGTLVALLLWLSRRFLRNGLRDVHQHRFAPARLSPAITATPHAARQRICVCPAHSVVLSAALRRFQQWCDSSRVRMACCA